MSNWTNRQRTKDINYWGLSMLSGKEIVGTQLDFRRK